MRADEAQPNVAYLDWRRSEYEAAPVAYLQPLAEQSPVARAEVGYAILTRGPGRPVMRANLLISLRNIPETIGPYLADRTKQPLLTWQDPEHASLRNMLTRVQRSRAIEALRRQIPTAALRAA